MIIVCPFCRSQNYERIGDYPDTRTSTDMFEAECTACKSTYVVEVDLQDNSVATYEIPD